MGEGDVPKLSLLLLLFTDMPPEHSTVSVLKEGTQYTAVE
jgi:hypothetical protein